MISITFGLGQAGTTEFFPESEFSVLLEDESISVFVEEAEVLAVLEEDNITIQVEV